ncbi:expressed unknown protein [Seminavis robusta]|uniref:Uncharacterized protein n=1 Tax=Seminavis robusta TaxID=568900 RepID=A0A9N8DPV4_9STRA|nr:expressed unknown protein [Seminavis robusta]|eukprot:Sro286_g108240.1 n/a (255) ;mRNA; f:21836-22600
MNPPRKRLGAVERLGKSSGPDPKVSLSSRNLNRSRVGNLYEKASSRGSRTKQALERHGEISRDVAVALGGNQHMRGTKKRKVFDEGMATFGEQMKDRGRERAIRIHHANLERRANAANGSIVNPNKKKKNAPAASKENFRFGSSTAIIPNAKTKNRQNFGKQPSSAAIQPPKASSGGKNSTMTSLQIENERKAKSIEQLTQQLDNAQKKSQQAEQHIRSLQEENSQLKKKPRKRQSTTSLKKQGNSAVDAIEID